MIQRFIVLGALCVGIVAPQAHAGYIWFTLNNAAVPGMQVTVAEQIVCLNPGNCQGNGNGMGTLDYQYYVFNTGAFVMDGFSLGVGGRAVAIAGGENYSDLAGGADGVFPAATGGGSTNAINFLAQPAVNPAMVTSQMPGEGATAFIPGGSTDVSQPGGGGWGFEEFDNFSAGQMPANKAYVARWYTAMQGGAGRATLYNNGCTGATPTANIPGTALNNTSGVLNTSLTCMGSTYYAVMRFDLFSPNGPVPGTGAPDPFGSGWDLSFDDDVNGTDTAFDATSLPPDTTVCNTGCSSLDTDFDSASDVVVSPEPGTMVLFGSALVGFGFLRRRK